MRLGSLFSAGLAGALFVGSSALGMSVSGGVPLDAAPASVQVGTDGAGAGGESSSPTTTEAVAAPSVTPTGSGEAGCDPVEVDDPALTRAPGTGRTVALTFDDGPDEYTPQVMQALADRGVAATFFAIGRKVAANPEAVAELARQGHLIGGHSWDHRYPRDVRGGWSATFVRHQMERTDAVIEEVTGVRPCFFRPPGGFIQEKAVPQVAAERDETVSMWSVDPKDWEVQSHPGDLDTQTSTIVDRSLAGLEEEHPVLLMHDGGGFRAATAAALPRVIDAYLAHGYRFVRLDGRDLDEVFGRAPTIPSSPSSPVDPSSPSGIPSGASTDPASFASESDGPVPAPAGTGVPAFAGAPRRP
jgi:peptidoglycan-N-acetylglucosamine deacetylase